MASILKENANIISAANKITRAAKRKALALMAEKFEKFIDVPLQKIKGIAMDTAKVNIKSGVDKLVKVEFIIDGEKLKEKLNTCAKEMIYNENENYYKINPTNLTLTIHMNIINEKINKIIRYIIENHIKNEEHKEKLRELKINLNKILTNDKIVFEGISDLQSFIKNLEEFTQPSTVVTAGKRRTKKIYKKRKNFKGGGEAEVNKFFDMAKRAAVAMKQTMPDFEDNATSPPNSERQAPEQQETATTKTKEQAREQQRNVPTERGGMPIVDEKLIENANRKVRIVWPRGVKKGGTGPTDEECAATVNEGAAQKQVCKLINEVVENKIKSKKGELDKMTDDAVKNIRKNLEGTMLKTIHEGFDENIQSFYKKAVDTPESNELLDAIIGEIGMKFDDSLANGLDGKNIEAYELAIQSLTTAKNKMEEAKKPSGGKKTKKKPSKTNKKKPSKTNKKKPSKTIKKKPSKTIKKKKRTRKKR